MKITVIILSFYSNLYTAKFADPQRKKIFFKPNLLTISVRSRAQCNLILQCRNKYSWILEWLNNLPYLKVMGPTALLTPAVSIYLQYILTKFTSYRWWGLYMHHYCQRKGNIYWNLVILCLYLYLIMKLNYYLRWYPMFTS